MNKKIQEEANTNEHDELQAQAKEWEHKYKRALADYQNLVRQSEKEREMYVRFANTTFISQILPILDSLEMAQRHLEDAGLDMVIKQMHQILEQTGVKKIEPSTGETFNPEWHECIETMETQKEAEDQKIAKVHTRGYQWSDGMVIRHARVSVFSFKEATETSDSEVTEE